jgi:hypothetical protein
VGDEKVLFENGNSKLMYENAMKEVEGMIVCELPTEKTNII